MDAKGDISSSAQQSEYDTPVSREVIVLAAYELLGENFGKNGYVKESGSMQLGLLVSEPREAVHQFSSHYLKCAACYGNSWEDKLPYEEVRQEALQNLRQQEETARF